MVDAVRTVPHGVAVVPSDFKDNLQRASAYVPERKKYSGYEDMGEASNATNQSSWREVIADWKQSDNSPAERDRSGSTSTSMSEIEFDKTDPISVNVEKLSPALVEAWKKSQEQKLRDSMEGRTQIEGTTQMEVPLSFSPRSNLEIHDQFARNTSSVESFSSERNPSSVNLSAGDVHVPSNIDSGIGSQISITQIPPYIDPPGSNVNPPSLYGPPAPPPHMQPTMVYHQRYVPPPPMIPPPVTVAPIGTPAYGNAYTGNTFGIEPMRNASLSGGAFSGFNSSPYWSRPQAPQVSGHPPLTAMLRFMGNSVLYSHLKHLIIIA